MGLRIGLVLMALCCAGCVAMEDLCYRKSRALKAETAWHHSAKPPHCPQRSHYARGWKQGYYDVARGGSGCQPSVAPEKYWGLKYQNARGQEAVQAWYAGYQAGALAAQCEGANQYNPVPGLPDGVGAAPLGPLVESGSVAVPASLEAMSGVSASTPAPQSYSPANVMQPPWPTRFEN